MPAEDDHYRPYTSSCPRCRASLTLDAVRSRGVWYCSPACAAGAPGPRRQPSVPEDRLWNRPRRFWRKRRPKELRSAPRASVAHHQ